MCRGRARTGRHAARWTKEWEACRCLRFGFRVRWTVGHSEKRPIFGADRNCLFQWKNQRPQKTKTAMAHCPGMASETPTARLQLCSNCFKSLKSGSAVLMALDQPFCSERCRSEFVFTQAEQTSEPHTRAYRQRSEGQGVFISDPKRSRDSPQSPREFIQLYPVSQPRWSESSLAS